MKHFCSAVADWLCSQPIELSEAKIIIRCPMRADISSLLRRYKQTTCIENAVSVRLG